MRGSIREKVYKAIDSERDYQDKYVIPDPARCRPNPDHSVGDFLTMMRAYMSKADMTWINTVGDTETLKVIRKIAGIAVQCMEKHGAINR